MRDMLLLCAIRKPLKGPKPSRVPVEKMKLSWVFADETKPSLAPAEEVPEASGDAPLKSLGSLGEYMAFCFLEGLKSNGRSAGVIRILDKTGASLRG